DVETGELGADDEGRRRLTVAVDGRLDRARPGGRAVELRDPLRLDRRAAAIDLVEERGRVRRSRRQQEGGKQASGYDGARRATESALDLSPAHGAPPVACFRIGARRTERGVM